MDIAVIEHNTNINDISDILYANKTEDELTEFEDQVMEKDVGTSQTQIFVSKGQASMLAWEFLINDYRAVAEDQVNATRFQE